MPSTSKKQHRFMLAIAHNPAFAKKAGVPQSVGKDFAAADKGKTFSKGMEVATKKSNASREKTAAALIPLMQRMAAMKQAAPRGPAMPPRGAPMGPPGGVPMKKGGKARKK